LSETKSLPVVNPRSTIPAALRIKAKEELDDMEKRGVVHMVKESADWVNSVAIVEKPNGSLRIYLVPRHLNKAIKWNIFRFPPLKTSLHIWQMQNGSPS